MNFTRFLTPLLWGLAVAFTLPVQAQELKPRGAGSKDVTAAQVNGTWQLAKNTFKIWALGGGKLQLAFDGIYEYKSPAGPTANTGEASGIATIVGDTAIFHPEGGEPNDKITLVFTGEKLVVQQEGGCGFGNHVFAAGTYRKVSKKKPKFEE